MTTPIYRAAFGIAGVNSTDGVLANLKASAGVRCRLTQAFFGIQVAPTNAPRFGFKRMNAVGTGSITAATIAQHDAAEGAATAALETAWATTRPTVTGGYFGDGIVPTVIGNGFLFDFIGREIVVALSGGLCLLMVNASGATTGTICGWVEWME
jgi:hypothetical protein